MTFHYSGLVHGAPPNPETLHFVPSTETASSADHAPSFAATIIAADTNAVSFDENRAVSNAVNDALQAAIGANTTLVPVVVRRRLVPTNSTDTNTNATNPDERPQIRADSFMNTNSLPYWRRVAEENGVPETESEPADFAVEQIYKLLNGSNQTYPSQDQFNDDSSTNAFGLRQSFHKLEDKLNAFSKAMDHAWDTLDTGIVSTKVTTVNVTLRSKRDAERNQRITKATACLNKGDDVRFIHKAELRAIRMMINEMSQFQNLLEVAQKELLAREKTSYKHLKVLAQANVAFSAVSLIMYTSIL